MLVTVCGHWFLHVQRSNTHTQGVWYSCTCSGPTHPQTVCGHWFLHLQWSNTLECDTLVVFDKRDMERVRAPGSRQHMDG